MKKKRLPRTPADWLKEIAQAYKDASEAKPFGELSIGRSLKDEELFHLAPQVFFKFRGIGASEHRKNEIIEGTLASYVATIDAGEGGKILEASPVLAFSFCYLAAHFVADLIDDMKVAAIMDHCVDEFETLENMISNS